jgi:hypothetical protein
LRIPELLMKRLLALSLLASLFLSSAAAAATFPIPDENPVATVSLPEKWESSPYDGGIESTSPDGKIYVAMEVVAAKDVKSATEEGLEFFAKQGVEINPESLKTKDTKINGLSAFDLQFTGKDKDGPAKVSLTLVATNAEGKFLMLYYWGSEAGEQANGADLQAISDSIQATK